MKKFFRYLLVLVIIVVFGVAIGAAFIGFRDVPSYDDIPVPDYHVDVTPARVERGKKLASMLCVHCHADPKTGVLTGTRMLDAPAEFGVINSQNITQDRTYGIGTYTDGELLRLLRTGIKKNGQYSPPYMAKLPHMADEDINAVIAFLRSDDPLVAPKALMDTPCEPSFLTKFLCMVAFKPLPMPEKSIPLPDTTNKVQLGKYLVHNLDCFTCHSADFKKMDVLHPENSLGYLGGGNKTLNMEGQEIVTLNITPDKETGIGNWTEEEFVTALKYGIKKNQPALRYPMMPFTQLTDYEAQAIYAYLFTVPPIHNKIQRVFTTPG
jgi:mono/diheme cytochrome c family protein